jgi:hypothetical protein
MRPAHVRCTPSGRSAANESVGDSASKTAELQKQLERKHVLDMEWISTHQLLAISCLDGYISFWEVHAEEILWRRPSLVSQVQVSNYAPQTGMKYVPVCDCLFSWTSGGNGTLLVWNVRPASLRCELQHHAATVT